MKWWIPVSLAIFAVLVLCFAFSREGFERIFMTPADSRSNGLYYEGNLNDDEGDNERRLDFGIAAKAANWPLETLNVYPVYNAWASIPYL